MSGTSMATPVVSGASCPHCFLILFSIAFFVLHPSSHYNLLIIMRWYSGLAALHLSGSPGLTPAQVKARILEDATKDSIKAPIFLFLIETLP